MTREEEPTKEELNLGNIGHGGCPCGEAEDENGIYKAHCWRVGGCCTYSGVHFKVKKDKAAARKKAKQIADYIKESWRTGVTVSSNPRV